MSTGTTPPEGSGTDSGSGSVAGTNSGGWSSFTTVERWTIVSGIGTLVGALIAVIALFGPFGSDDKPVAKNVPLMSTTTSSAPVTTTSTTPTTTLSTVASEPAPPVYSGGTVRIYNGSGGVTFSGNQWLDPGYNGSSEILVDDKDGVSAGNGSTFAVVENPSYSTCRNADYSVQSLSWDQLPSKTSVCIKTSDARVGKFQVTWKKNREGDADDMTVVGVIWQPTS
ncbi:hypothetical protein ACFWPX_36430 [Nocardia sp. NPDC058518]|uniref:hypothetical protein n=1 Tax=Nocardia sp. NPDC058518 TaxID=3346534 RepID=UPI0036631C8F